MEIINLNYCKYVPIFAFCPYCVVLFAFKAVVIHNNTSIYLLFANWQNPPQGFEPCRPPERMTEKYIKIILSHYLKYNNF